MHIILLLLYFQLLIKVIYRTGVQQARKIRPESMNPVSIPELTKVSRVKTLGATSSKWPKKVNTVKQQLVGKKINQSKIQMQTHQLMHKQLVSDSNTTGLLLPKTRLQYLQKLTASTTLPREILASVRKNKKIYDEQKQRLQWAAQRHKMFTTHTVVLKVANKQKKFRQGNKHKILSQKWRRNRVRRESQDASNSKAEQEIKKQPSTSELVNNANMIIRKGTLLLLTLDNLLKDANFHLPNEAEVINFNSNYSMNTVRNSEIVAKALPPQKFPQSKVNVSYPLFDSKISHPTTKEGYERKISRYILKHTCTKQPDRKAADTLLYEDVIANIRNMQLTQNIQLKEKEQNIIK